MKMIGGAEYNLHTYLLKGSSTGPRVYIQASLHGSEIQGNAVIYQLIQELKDKDIYGEVLFAPVVNPFATNHKVGTYSLGRYNPITGDNWNRNFIDIFKNFDLSDFCKKSLKDSEIDIHKKFKVLLENKLIEFELEQSTNNKIHLNNNLNLKLQKMAANADIVLDLHTGPTATEYLYTAKRSFEDSLYLHFENILVIENEFSGAMDEATFMPWVYLEKKFNELGREIKLNFHSFTLELNSEEGFDINHAKAQSKKILNFLAYKGIIKEKYDKKEARYSDLKDYKTIYAPVSGFVDYHLEVGSLFKKGDLLCKFYQLENLKLDCLDEAVTEITASEDGVLINRCPSSSVLQGMELFQVMEKIKKLNLI